MRQLCNKTTLSLLGLIVWALLSRIAYGGHEVGNGGNVVECEKSVELLDLFEARVLRNETFIESAKRDPFELAQDRLELLRKIDPRTAEIVAKLLKRLKTDISFESTLALGPIPDSEHVFTPEDPKCKVVQAAVFRKQPMAGEKKVLFNERLWKKMDSVQQAALLLHEAIYKHFSDLGETTSVKARFFVALILSKDFGPKTADTYWSAVRKMKLPLYPRP